MDYLAVVCELGAAIPCFSSRKDLVSLPVDGDERGHRTPLLVAIWGLDGVVSEPGGLHHGAIRGAKVYSEVVFNQRHGLS